MADNVVVSAGTGTTIAADEVVDGTLGTVKVGYIKIMDGTIDGTSKAAVGANGLAVDVKAAVITSGTITTVGAVTAITNALPAGTNAIGKLSANSGVDIGDVDVTSVSGNVTVVQGTGTNLHAVIDTGSTTAVTQATGTNLHAVIDTGSTTAVTQATGTNLHAVLDTGSTTAVTQATGTNLHTVVDSGTITTVSTVTTITNVVHVDDNSSSLTVDNGGTFAVQATAVGTIADDATTPGNPVMIGGKAVDTDGTDPTSVSAEDDVAICRTDRNRRLLVSSTHPNLWRGNENNATAQTDNPIKSAPGANLSLYITDIILSNGATAGTFLIEEDTAGAKTTLLGPYYLGINSGMSKKFQTPVRCTANKDIGYTTVTVTTHTVTVIGYTAP